MKAERTRLNRQEWRAIGTLSGVFFLRMLGIFLVLPVLSPYASHMKGASPLLVGLAFGAFPLLQTAFQVPFGWMSDRFGRKPMIAVALCMFTAGSVWAAFAHSIWTLIGAMALQGSGAVAAGDPGARRRPDASRGPDARHGHHRQQHRTRLRRGLRGRTAAGRPLRGRVDLPAHGSAHASRAARRAVRRANPRKARAPR